MSSVGFVILAAGASTRMGTPKQLLPYQGGSLLGHTVQIGIASKCQPIVVVLGAYAEQIKPEISQLPVQIVENPQWILGMGTSIQTGVKALVTLNQSLDALAIALCDQPFLSIQVIHQLVEAYQLTGKQIVASEYDDTLGVPALFSCNFFSELMMLGADAGAKHLIRKFAQEVFPVSFPQGAIDIDTPQDYRQLQF